MRNILICLVLLMFTTASAVWAGPAAMVSDVQGRVVTTNSKGQQKDVRKATLLKQGAKLEMQPGASLTLVYFRNRKTQELSGQGGFTVGERGVEGRDPGVKLVGDTMVASGATADPLVDNPIVMAGATVRGRLSDVLMAGKIYNLKVSGSGEGGWRVSWETAVDGPYDVTLNPIPDLNSTDDQASANPKQSSKKLENGRFLYVVESADAGLTDPLVAGQSYVVMVESREKRGELACFQRFRTLDGEQQDILDRSLPELRQWSAEEPENPLPWMLQTALYDQFDQLPQAAKAARTALEKARGTDEEPVAREKLTEILAMLGQWEDIHSLGLDEEVRKLHPEG